MVTVGSQASVEHDYALLHVDSILQLPILCRTCIIYIYTEMHSVNHAGCAGYCLFVPKHRTFVFFKIKEKEEEKIQKLTIKKSKNTSITWQASGASPGIRMTA